MENRDLQTENRQVLIEKNKILSLKIIKLSDTNKTLKDNNIRVKSDFLIPSPLLI